MFHLGESGHDGEEHRPHRCRGVDVASTQVQDPEARAAGAESVGQSDHVLGGSPEPVQRGDDESVALYQRVQCPIELRP
jgi:hypothetical protein